MKADLPPTKMMVQSEEIGQDVASLILFLGGISTADLFCLKEEMCDDDTIRYNRCKTRNSRRDNAYCELPIQNVSDILSGSIEQRKEVDIILTSMRNIVRWIVLTLASMPVYLGYVNTIRWGK